MVSRSGQMVSPCRMRSSPTFTTAVTSEGSAPSLSARSSRAAPTPPLRTVITSETLEGRGYHRVVSNDADSSWPGSYSSIVLRLDGGTVRRIAENGDLDEVRPWASVSKMTVAMGFGVGVD